MKLLYLILILGLLLLGGVLACFGVQQSIIGTGIVSSLWAIYSVSIIWLAVVGVYCFVQLMLMRDDL